MNVQAPIRMVPLGEAAIIERSGVAPDQIKAGTSYLGLEHIATGGDIIEVARVNPGDLASTKFAFGPEHVLFGKLRPYLAKIALPDFKGVCSTDIVPIRPGPHLDRRYLAHFLRQPRMVEFAASRATGVNLPRLSPKALAKLEIPLPALAEQERIAAILDQADALRRLRRRALDRLSDLGQSIFHDMFGEDPVSPIQDFCDVITDGTHQTPIYTDNGVIFLSARNVTKRKIDWSDVKYVSVDLHSQISRSISPRRNDILLAKNGTTGVAAKVETDFEFSIYVSLALLRPASGVDPDFLLFAVNDPRTKIQFDRHLKGIGVSNLHLKDIRSANIPSPPIERQRLFSSKLASIIETEHRLEMAAASASELFASLQARAFFGNI